MKPFDYQFKANGADYTLRYNFQVRLDFEEKYKKTVPGMLKRLADAETQTAAELVDILKLMLSADNPKITNVEVCKIIDDLGGEDETLALIMRALAIQTPPEEGARP